MARILLCDPPWIRINAMAATFKVTLGQLNPTVCDLGGNA